MILDIILAVIVLVWAVFGYRKGFIRQIFVFIAVLAVSLASAPLADIAEKVITEEFDIVLVGRYTKVFLLTGCAATIFIVLTLIGRFLHDTLVDGIPMAEKTNHVLGAVLGIVSSAIALVFILGVFAVGNAKIEHYAPSVAQFLNQSTSYQIVLENNPVLVFDFFKDYKKDIQTGRSSDDTKAEDKGKNSKQQMLERSSADADKNSKTEK